MGPVSGHPGVEPDRVGKSCGDEPEPFNTRLSRGLLDVYRAVPGHEFVWGHARIPDNDESGLGVQLDQVIHPERFGAPRGVLPENIVDRVMEEKGLQILELGPGIAEQKLHHLHIRIHGPAAVVDGQNDLQPVPQAALKHDFDLSGVLHGPADGFIHIDFVPGPCRHQVPQPPQGFSHLGLSQGDVISVVPIAPVHGDFNRGLPAGDSADPHPSRVEAGMADRGHAAGADPPVASVMLAILVLEPVLEVLDQLFRAHSLQVLDLHIQSLGQGLGIVEPLLEQAAHHVVQFQALIPRQVRILEIVGKEPVVEVEVLFGLDQDGPGCGVEVVDGSNQPKAQGLVQPQKCRGRDRHAMIAQEVKKGDKHSTTAFWMRRSWPSQSHRSF